MPWVDMKEQMERLHIPLYCLESKDPLTDFDIVGFSLEYELCYTNILAMLDLAGIPLRAADRDERWPLIISGGPCVCNAEPMADFLISCSWAKANRCCRTSAPPWKQVKRLAGTRTSCCLNFQKFPACMCRPSMM